MLHNAELQVMAAVVALFSAAVAVAVIVAGQATALAEAITAVLPL